MDPEKERSAEERRGAGDQGFANVDVVRVRQDRGQDDTRDGRSEQEYESARLDSVK